MPWATILWSMIGSACLTLAAIYFQIWYKDRATWAHLFFATTAVATTGWAFCELWIMRAESVAEMTAAIRTAQVPMFFLLLSITLFVWTYLDAGRAWLAWTIFILRTLYVLPNLLLGHNPNFSEMADVRHIQFLGETIAVAGGVPNRFTIVGQFGVLLVLAFVADATVTAWRRGDRRKALVVGGSVEFFITFGLAASALVVWADVQAPLVVSPFFLGLVAVMGSELGRDVIRASQLVRELQESEAGLRESEARMSLAVDAADFGIWIRHLARREIWASEKWRELFGFGPSEPLEFNTILKRLHPADRDSLEQAHAMAIAGVDGGRYQAEYRLVLPDGETRWILSRGRVERDATGQPALIRVASRDITTGKRAELAVRNLSGRLLSAQEEERRRIARELHDNLSQQMALLAFEVEEVGMRLDPNAEVARSMRALGGRIAEISTEIHNLSHRLHSSKLEALGLEVAVRGHCRELRTQGLHVQCQADNVPDTLPYEVALCLFRVVQEGLNNVLKHSGAAAAQVSLTGTHNTIMLRVADAGRGFDRDRASGWGGLGLASMGERLRSVGGEVKIKSRRGSGTTIEARVPLAQEEFMAAARRVGSA